MGEAYYYLRDAHGDTIGLAESTGSVTKDYKHDAFGNLTAEYGTGAETPFRYNGQYTDSETGLIYLRNRYYDPTIGRFTQEDPVKDGMNWYAYCGNDPVNFVDPFGLLDKDVNWNNPVLSSEAIAKIKVENQKIVAAGKTCGWNSDNENLRKVTQEVNAEIDRIMQSDFEKYYNAIVYNIPVINQAGENACWVMSGLSLYMYNHGITSTSFENVNDIPENWESNAELSDSDKMIAAYYYSNYDKNNSNVNVNGTVNNLYSFVATSGSALKDIENNIKGGPVAVNFAGNSKKEISHVMTVVGYMKINNQAYVKYNDSNQYETSYWIPIEQFKTYNVGEGRCLTYSGYVGGGYFGN